MGFLKTGASAIGKLFIVVALAGAFLVGLVGVVYLSLQGKEVNVPEIIGKDFYESEKELTQLGLKIKKRAFRYSQEKPNTIIEQSPRSGEPVKTGQIIFVVVSQANPEGSEAPATVNKDEEVPVTDEGIENAPKKPNKNANVKKPAQISRDGAANKPPKNANTNVSSGDNANSVKSSSNSSTTTPTNKATPANKSTTTPTNTPKPSATKTPTSGDTRSRKIP